MADGAWPDVLDALITRPQLNRNDIAHTAGNGRHIVKLVARENDAVT